MFFCCGTHAKQQFYVTAGGFNAHWGSSSQIGLKINVWNHYSISLTDVHHPESWLLAIEIDSEWHHSWDLLGTSSSHVRPRCQTSFPHAFLRHPVPWLPQLHIGIPLEQLAGCVALSAPMTPGGRTSRDDVKKSFVQPILFNMQKKSRITTFFGFYISCREFILKFWIIPMKYEAVLISPPTFQSPSWLQQSQLKAKHVAWKDPPFFHVFHLGPFSKIQSSTNPREVTVKFIISSLGLEIANHRQALREFDEKTLWPLPTSALGSRSIWISPFQLQRTGASERTWEIVRFQAWCLYRM